MKKYLCILFLLPALLLAIPFSKANTQNPFLIEDVQDPNGTLTSVTLVWDQNGESDIAGYNIYYGKASGDYVGMVTVTEPTATVTVRGINLVYFAVTAFNTNGVESPLSDEVHWP